MDTHFKPLLKCKTIITAHLRNQFKYKCSTGNPTIGQNGNTAKSSARKTRTLKPKLAHPSAIILQPITGRKNKMNSSTNMTGTQRVNFLRGGGGGGGDAKPVTGLSNHWNRHPIPSSSSVVETI